MSWTTPWRQHGDFHQPLALEDKITIFEERVLGWQLDIADACINGNLPSMRHSGWAVLMIIFSYFEMIGQAKIGRAVHNKSREDFRGGLADVFPDFRSLSVKRQNEVVKVLYESGRCAFYHTGMARSRIIISSEFPQAVMLQWPEAVLINPHRLVPALKQHFRNYVAELRNPDNTDTRQKFERYFDYQQALDPLNNSAT